MIDYHTIMERFRDLQIYLGWRPEDTARIHQLAPLARECFPRLVEDFYQEIERHEVTRRVITGGEKQIARLKGTLLQWLEDLFSSEYDTEYVVRHWRIGYRHVEIGLPQIYAFAAFSRMRQGLFNHLRLQEAKGSISLGEAFLSLQRLLDIDLAIIEDAYDDENVARQRAAERQRGDTVFRNVVDLAGCMILLIRRDGSLAFANAYAARIDDLAASRSPHLPFVQEYVREEDRALFAEKLNAALHGELVHAFEAKLSTPQGLRAFLWDMRPLEHYEETVLALVVGHDITMLHEAQAKALQAERLAAIGQMSAGLAHESRNALQRMQACAEMLEFEVENNAEALDLVKRMQIAQEQLLHMFDEVRGYAGPLNLEKSKTPIQETWREAWQLLRIERRDRAASLHDRLEHTDGVCLHDRFRMVQVFRNLLENALTACTDPVEIHVSCEPCELHGVPGIMVTVRDNGPGFASEPRRRAFEPFFTTKARGTGLGMAIAQRFVEAHGGVITLGDRRGPGAEIMVTLPLG